jgi:predicted DNA-binding ribbon-helix-helix protein
MSGRRTSARLESPLWQAFDEICTDHGVSRAMLARLIDARRARGTGLTSALRIFLLSYYRNAARKDVRSRTEDGLLNLISALDKVGPPGESQLIDARGEWKDETSVPQAEKLFGVNKRVPSQAP